MDSIIKIKYDFFGETTTTEAKVNTDLFLEVFQNGDIKQRCEYARVIIEETDPKIPKDYILSFSINDIVLLELGKPEWKDGFKLDPPVTKRMR